MKKNIFALTALLMVISVLLSSCFGLGDDQGENSDTETSEQSQTVDGDSSEETSSDSDTAVSTDSEAEETHTEDDTEDGSETESETEGESETETEKNDIADEEYLILYSDKTSHFDVIKAADLAEGFPRTKQMGDFFEAILLNVGEKYGADTAPDFTDKTDGSSERVEIHYGVTADPESRELLDSVPLDAHGYCVRGNKIFIYGHTLSELSRAGSDFVKFMRKNSARDENNNKKFTVPKDTNVVFNDSSLAILEAPRPHIGEDLLFCDDGDGGRLWVVSGCTAEDYHTYRAAVTEAAFELYFENEIDGNLFSTYKKDGVLLDVWYTKDGYVRITATRGFEPMPYEQTVIEAVTTPGVALVGGVTDEKARSQMMFFKLSDGRFVVVDGGLKSGTTMAKLFSAMQNVAEDPDNIVIACWLFTHTHGDHIGAIQELAPNYKTYEDKLTVESFMHNFSDNEQALVPAQEVGSNDELRGYFKKFPDAKIYKAHPGNVAYFGDMKIEVLSTFENYIYTAFPNNWNAVNSMYKITLGGQVILIPGDTSNYDQETLVDIYSDALKCDILQAVHHGFRGGTVAMYRLCRPKVVLFCCCNEGEYGIGNFINNDYNQALVDPAQNSEFEEYFVAGTDVTYLPLPYRAGTSIVLELGL